MNFKSYETRENLTKIIEKAINNGFKFSLNKDAEWYVRQHYEGIVIAIYDGITDTLYPIDSVIFRHDFAKALWGEEYVCSDCGNPLRLPHPGSLGHAYTTHGWIFHLQQLVISEDRIKYLEEHAL